MTNEELLVERTEGTAEVETSRPREVSEEEFAAEWDQIGRDLEGEAAGALRIGLNLIKIKAGLPHGRWLPALREHGMSPSQATRYMRYANLDPRDREIRQRDSGFSLTDAIGERRSKKEAASEVGEGSGADEVQISADQLAGVEQRLKLAVRMVEAGERALAADWGEPEYAEDQDRWRIKLSRVAEALIEAITTGASPEAVLRNRLLPGAE